MKSKEERSRSRHREPSHGDAGLMLVKGAREGKKLGRKSFRPQRSSESLGQTDGESLGKRLPIEKFCVGGMA